MTTTTTEKPHRKTYRTIGEARGRTTMTWAEIMSLVAQGAINIAEGHTNIEKGSPVHQAMLDLCERFTAIETGKEALPPQFESVAAHLGGYCQD